MGMRLADIASLIRSDNSGLEEVREMIEFDPAAIKIDLKRPIVSADLGDTDTYGAHQHNSSLDLELRSDLPI